MREFMKSLGLCTQEIKQGEFSTFNYVTMANTYLGKITTKCQNLRLRISYMVLCFNLDIISAKYHRSLKQAAPSDDSSVSQYTECSTSTIKQQMETCETQQYVNMKDAQLLLNSLGLQNLDVQQKQSMKHKKHRSVYLILRHFPMNKNQNRIVRKSFKPEFVG